MKLLNEKGERILRVQKGKYTFVKRDSGELTCLRYGEEWRDFIGDKAINSLFEYAWGHGVEDENG